MDFEQVITDPTRAFSRPEEVVDHPGFTRQQKIDILHRWEYDARELEVAEEENMAGGPPDLLPRILAALDQLGRCQAGIHHPPSKAVRKH